MTSSPRPFLRSSVLRSVLSATAIVGAMLGTMTALPALTASSAAAADSSVLAGVAPRAASDFTGSVGICVHTAYGDTPYGDTGKVIAALQKLGVTHVRDDLFLDNSYEYANIKKLYQAGIRFNLIAGRPNNGQSAQTYINTLTSQLPAGSVESIEGPNEWDIAGGGGNWASALRTYQTSLYSAVHNTPALNGVPVVAPSLAFRSNYSQLGAMSGASDIANSHNYTGGRVPTYQLSQVLPQVRQMSGNTPVYVTETGYTNAVKTTDGHRPVPEDVSATYLPRTLLTNFAAGVNRTYLYELIDEFDEGDQTNIEANFGLLHHDWTPKPAFNAIANLMALAADSAGSVTLKNLDYSIAGAPSDTQQVLLQKTDGSYVLLLWRDQATFDRDSQQYVSAASAPVTLQLPATEKLSVYRPGSGTAATSSSTGTSLALNLDANVTAVTIAAAPTTSTTSTPTSPSSPDPTTPAPTTPSPTTPAPDPTTPDPTTPSSPAPTTTPTSPAPTSPAPTSPAPTTPSNPAPSTPRHPRHPRHPHLHARVRGGHIHLSWAVRSQVQAYRVRVGTMTRTLSHRVRSLTVTPPAHRRSVVVTLGARTSHGWTTVDSLRLHL